MNTTAESHYTCEAEPTELFDKGGLVCLDECLFKKCCKKYKKKGKYCRKCPKL